MSHSSAHEASYVIRLRKEVGHISPFEARHSLLIEDRTEGFIA